MDYTLTKLLPIFVYPLGLALVLGLLSLLALMRGRPRLGGLWVTLSLLILWVSAMPMLADYISRSLEDRHPFVKAGDLPEAKAIVLLGGGVGRLIRTASLYRADRAPLLLLSGGGVKDSEPESVTMMQMLSSLGVPRDIMLLESDSRNTYENAKFSASLLQSMEIDRVLLVTSAIHMPRAKAVFENFGISVIPAATDYQDQNRVGSILDWMPDVQALLRTTLVIKEHLAWQVYTMRGWISD